ncbi:uncharacterized protein LOC135226763 [Macrobrachium nipponense]|uniref:uncharacterized protein LOC135226763 n=1 Tax=Macrobrachium nipponense TaxID=159736 RepID=UPI0030C841B9
MSAIGLLKDASGLPSAASCQTTTRETENATDSIKRSKVTRTIILQASGTRVNGSSLDSKKKNKKAIVCWYWSTYILNKNGTSWDIEEEEAGWKADWNSQQHPSNEEPQSWCRGTKVAEMDESSASSEMLNAIGRKGRRYKTNGQERIARREAPCERANIFLPGTSSGWTILKESPPSLNTLHLFPPTHPILESPSLPIPRPSSQLPSPSPTPTMLHTLPPSPPVLTHWLRKTWTDNWSNLEQEYDGLEKAHSENWTSQKLQEGSPSPLPLPHLPPNLFLLHESPVPLSPPPPSPTSPTHESPSLSPPPPSPISPTHESPSLSPPPPYPQQSSYSWNPLPFHPPPPSPNLLPTAMNTPSLSPLLPPSQIYPTHESPSFHPSNHLPQSTHHHQFNPYPFTLSLHPLPQYLLLNESPSLSPPPPFPNLPPTHEIPLPFQPPPNLPTNLYLLMNPLAFPIPSNLPQFSYCHEIPVPFPPSSTFNPNFSTTQ